MVVLSYNGKELHKKFLPGILAEKANYPDFDLVVVDNASTDGTYDYVKENFPEAKLIRLDVNRGFTNGYIEGFRRIEAEIFVLLSADFEVTPGWLNPIIDLMDSDPKVAAAQPKIKYYRQKTHFEYAGAAGGFIDKYGYPFCRGRIFFTLEEDKGQYDDTREIFWASGGCMFVRSDLYFQFGELDNDFYAHMEEIDLCWRMKNAGYKIMGVPESTVYHVGGSVIEYGSPIKIYHNYRNGLVLLVKNLPQGKLLGTLIKRLLLDYVSLLRSILKFNFREMSSIIKAHWNFYTNVGKWLRKRKEVRKMVTTPNTAGIYPRSIVKDYFLGGKKRFSDLKF